MEKQWYVIYTAVNAEEKLYKKVTALGIEAYLPLERSIRQWSDRKKEIVKPIFKSYLFVRQSTDEYHEVKCLPGFLQYVSFGHQVAIIPDTDIRLMKSIVDNFNQIKIADGLVKGDKVKILFGPLGGHIGVLTQDQGKAKVALYVQKLKHSFMLDMKLDNIIKL
ncbi:UpxY family transcription antiterminator [Shewanella surugensis]|uniref:UpxY family transcription antiterminator n=1 Tax=Shewanella surugensis TaxID=212020 RepID=A0ABT0LF26_9GAMM|nr:UpxY family transcription antiterminator [Shewanella surugensis]MCL1126090.1 UpxY family transcription antiterminator [Shewanella surugensis]